MIKKLRRKFTILATVSISILMLMLVCIMNIINYSSVVSEADATLDVITEPNAPFFKEKDPTERPERQLNDFIPRGMSLEVPYESRFFTAMISSDDVIEIDASKIVSVENETAKEYVKQAMNSSSSRGFIKDFRYVKTKDDKVTRITFLDCGRKLNAFRNFMYISISISFFGCIIVFVVFLFASGRIVRPIAESYEKQKRFITDAGHEIRTPLTIINANLDLLDDDTNENLVEIRNQTKRLASLTNDLVYLSKMEESENTLPKVEFPISDLVQEIALSFQTLAKLDNKELILHIQPSLCAIGSPDAISQLVSILLENGIKYTPEKVEFNLFMQKKNIVLSVFNTTKEEVSKENLSHLFERFYRLDSSRNSSTGGHGIGLSIAKAITEAHGGKISAETKTGFDLQITVLLPQ